MVRDEVPRILRPVRLRDGQPGEVVPALGDRLTEDGVRREQVRIRRALVRVGVKRERVAGNQVLDADVVFDGQRRSASGGLSGRRGILFSRLTASREARARQEAAAQARPTSSRRYVRCLNLQPSGVFA